MARTPAKKKSPAAIARQKSMIEKRNETEEQKEVREVSEAESNRQKIEKKRREQADVKRKKAMQRQKAMGTGKRRLMAKEREGMHLRWVTDGGNRLAQMEEAGYSMVTPTPEEKEWSASTDAGDSISVITGVNKDGTVQRSYLMEKPQEWHDEDQIAKLAPVRKIEEQLKRGKVAGGLDDNESYTPDSGGIKIT